MKLKANFPLKMIKGIYLCSLSKAQQQNTEEGNDLNTQGQREWGQINGHTILKNGKLKA